MSRLAPTPPLPFSWSALLAFSAVTLGLVFVVGAVLVALAVPMNTPAYWVGYAVGLLSPFLGALVYVRRTTGSLAALRRMYWPLRLGRGAWMIVLLPVALALAFGIAWAAGLPVAWSARRPVASLFTLFVGWSAIMWAEETAWRGTLLPVLQARVGPLRATGLVAAVWILWHLPILYLLGLTGPQYAYFALQLLGLAAAMTWAYNRSGTALVPVLVHGAGNATMSWLLAIAPTVPANDLIAVQAAGALALGLGIVVLTRGRLGLPPGAPPRDTMVAGGTSVDGSAHPRASAAPAGRAA